jgi:hypothetical protein
MGDDRRRRVDIWRAWSDRVVEETSRGADGLAIPRDRVTLLTDAGIEQFIL